MERIFQTGHLELEKLCQEQTLQNLLAYFIVRTDEWQYPMIAMECFSVGVFHDLSNAFKNEGAFALMELSSRMPWNDFSDERFALGMKFVSNLASLSNTTEMPKELKAKWDEISTRMESIDPLNVSWEDLKRHYRLN